MSLTAPEFEAMTAGLPAPATAHHTGVAWWMARVENLEFQRQMDAMELARLRTLLLADGPAAPATASPLEEFA